MPPPRKVTDLLLILRPWPILITAIVFLIMAAILTLNGADKAAALGVAGLALGAVCLGAWLALLAAYGHSGRQDDTKND